MVHTRKKSRQKSPINRRKRDSHNIPLPPIQRLNYNSYRPERTRTHQAWDREPNDWALDNPKSQGLSQSEIYLKKKNRDVARKSAFSNSDMRLNFAKKKKRKKRSSDFNYLRSKYVSLNKKEWDSKESDSMLKTHGGQWRKPAPVMRNSLVIGKKPKTREPYLDLGSRKNNPRASRGQKYMNSKLKNMSNIMDFQNISDSLREMKVGRTPNPVPRNSGFLYHNQSDKRFGKNLKQSKRGKHRNKDLIGQFKKSKGTGVGLYNPKIDVGYKPKNKKTPKLDMVMRSLDMGRKILPARNKHFPSQRMTIGPESRDAIKKHLKRKNSFQFDKNGFQEHLKFSKTLNNSGKGSSLRDHILNPNYPNSKKQFERFSNLRKNKLSNSMNQNIDQINYQRMKEQINQTFKTNKNKREKKNLDTVKKRMPVAELIRQTPKSNSKSFQSRVERQVESASQLEGSANSYRVLETTNHVNKKETTPKIKTYSALEPSKIEVKPKVKKSKVPKGPNFSIKFANVDGLDKGKTKVGQDSVLVQKFEFQNKHFYLFGIFDGHGRHGHFVSQFLKKNFGSCLKKMMIENQSQHVCIETLISDTVKILHRRIDEIHNQATAYTLSASKNSSIPKMIPSIDLFDASLSGSTCALILMFEDQIFSVSLGDSRGILGFMDNSLLKPCQISREHKTSDVSEKMRILQCGGIVQPVMDVSGISIGPDRVWDSTLKYPGLLVTRSFGDLVGKACGVSGVPGLFIFFYFISF